MTSPDRKSMSGCQWSFTIIVLAVTSLMVIVAFRFSQSQAQGRCNIQSLGWSTESYFWSSEPVYALSEIEVALNTGNDQVVDS